MKESLTIIERLINERHINGKEAIILITDILKVNNTCVLPKEPDNTNKPQPSIAYPSTTTWDEYLRDLGFTGVDKMLYNPSCDSSGFRINDNGQILCKESVYNSNDNCNTQGKGTATPHERIPYTTC